MGLLSLLSRPALPAVSGLAASSGPGGLTAGAAFAWSLVLSGGVVTRARV